MRSRTISLLLTIFAVAAAAVAAAPAAAVAAAAPPTPREPITPPLAAAASVDDGEDTEADDEGEAVDEEPPLRVSPPSRARGATVARIVAPAFARAALDKPRKGRRVGTATAWSGQSQILLVLDAAVRDGVEWVKVLLPVRPNGTTGWIPRDHVTIGYSPYWVEIGVRSRTVTVFRNGRRVLRTRAVVGRQRTPTPLGLAAIYERNRQPNPRAFLGPWALSLTSLSNVLFSYGGGPGRVAIHGRAGDSFKDPLGSARSHGCIRIDNRPVNWMARNVPPGTPVMTTKR
ncbi:L,D-transpeptidase [Conexibacter arvalis]|uniref:Lipoprotein-anchoring transpeptidase ErfK/SrfK n=1 Tax=Conexibacter arvalis TaxID=912552 RepID=A0A840IHH2_9ACTN|nr:L,D-transpeptidase [Conexibacter arvalis]MBB4664226.1 lipoprotein-anchoring transpeptidase ErfK/SrfK [Conexibacter arvalis]